MQQIDSRLKLQVHDWYHTLMAIGEDLSDEMDDQDLQDELDIQQKIKPEYDKWVAMSQKGTTYVSETLYKSLDQYGRLLRKIMKKRGLKMKYADDASKALR